MLRISMMIILAAALLPAGGGCKKKSPEPPAAATLPSTAAPEPAPPTASEPAPPPPLGAPLPKAPASAVARATVNIEPRSGGTLRGSATFVASGSNVALDVRIENAPPGQRAVHLHEKGDCSAADATSAGEHWNPQHAAHGKFGVPPYHLGDIGNIEVGADGKGALMMTTDRWTIGSGAVNDVLRKSLVIHGGADDLKSQPAGNAGNRIGCGVVEPGRSI